MKYTELR